MSNLLSTDVEYKQWLQSLSQRFRQSQIKAAVKVNQELLAFYWELGKDIVEMNAESRWGSGFIDNLSKDLQQIMPSIKGLSTTNLRYIKRFYLLYSPLIQERAVPELSGYITGKNALCIAGSSEISPSQQAIILLNLCSKPQ